MMNLVKESIRSLKSYQVPKEYIKTKLDANENPYNLLEVLKDQWIGEIENLDMNRYPDTDSDELRNIIAQGLGLEKENIICGNGSDEIIQILINTFVDKGEYVITHSPTFSMYKILTTIAGGKTIEVPSNESFQINVDGMIKEAKEKEAKLIFLCNPNNPTGTVISRESIERIIVETEAIIVVDEAYYEFLDETVIELVNTYDRLIVLRTLSKAFALAGARVGYGAAGKKMMELLYRVKAPYNLNTFSQEIGKLFLKNIDLVKESIRKIKEEREYLKNKLNGINNIQVFPSGGNFILIKTQKSEELLNNCKEQGIAIRVFGNDGALKNCIRITVGTREENDKLLSLIEKVV